MEKTFSGNQTIAGVYLACHGTVWRRRLGLKGVCSECLPLGELLCGLYLEDFAILLGQVPHHTKCWHLTSVLGRTPVSGAAEMAVTAETRGVELVLRLPEIRFSKAPSVSLPVGNF